MHKKLQIPIMAIIFMIVFSLLMHTTAYAASNQTKIKSIQKARPKITMTANDEQLTVKVNKVKYATQYQFKYSTNKNFKNAKKVTTKSRTFTLKTKENKNYYVKCRAVVKVKNKNYYSKWSKIKAKIITKKAYNKTIIDEEKWSKTVTVFNYDGYIPTSSEDSRAHASMLMDMYVDSSYHAESIEISKEEYDRLAAQGSNGLSYYKDETVVHHKAKYKIKIL